jgi:dolichol kinase
VSKPAGDVPAIDLGDLITAPVDVAFAAPPRAAPSRAAPPAAALEEVPKPPARPANYARSLFHLGSAALALVLMRLLPGRRSLVAVSAAFALSGWTMEIARRRSPAVNARLMALFAPVAHPHERHGVNSATYYVTALLVLALLAPLRAAELGVVVLGLADPAAGLVGRRFGRTRLRKNRSLEGTLGFVVVGAVAAAAWLAAAYTVPLPALVVLALVAGMAGALIELVSVRLDDNLTIPVGVAAAVSVAQAILLI